MYLLLYMKTITRLVHFIYNRENEADIQVTENNTANEITGANTTLNMDRESTNLLITKCFSPSLNP